ncbi:MAG TPA: c-type cytochrome [Candidatus Aquilonibacter sp.]|nr:c-type cytochrome [Candidatus Aquilonibacter sp.]
MERISKVLGLGVLFGGAVLAFTLVSGTPQASFAAGAPPPAQQQTAEDVYLDKCAVCHAKDGSGNTAKGRKVKAKDLRSAEVQKMSDKDLLDAIANGKGKDMDGFKDELGMPMVTALEKYVRTQFGNK